MFRENAHKATSIHGRETLENLLRSLDSNATVFVKNKNKFENMLPSIGLKTPKLLASFKFADSNVAQPDGIVNSDTEGRHSIEPPTEQTTKVDTNPQNHTPAQQKVIEEFAAAVDENLVDYIKNSLENKGANKNRYNLKPVSDRAAEDIKAITGIDSTGFATVIEQRMAEHIVDRHGNVGAANQSMKDINDIARMQYVIDNYDNIVSGGYTRAYSKIGGASWRGRGWPDVWIPGAAADVIR